MDRTPQLIGPDLVTLVNLQMRQYGGLRQAIQDTFSVVLNRLVKDLGAFLLILKYLSPEFYDCPEGGILLLGF